MSIRSDFLNGAKYNEFAQNGTLSVICEMYFFPADTVVSALTYEDGETALVDYFGAGTTSVPGGTTIAAPEGRAFASISGTSGGVNYLPHARVAHGS